MTIDELITMVNIALDRLLGSGCAAGDINGDAAVTIDELITAVARALDGCQ